MNKKRILKNTNTLDLVLLKNLDQPAKKNKFLNFIKFLFSKNDFDYESWQKLEYRDNHIQSEKYTEEDKFHV